MPLIKGLFTLEASSRGGKTRAERLTPEQRRDIAKQGASARWAIPQATHGSPDSPLCIGDIEIPCYVLDNGKRVLVQQRLIEALDISAGRVGDRLAHFVAQNRLKPYVSNELIDRTVEPIHFRIHKGNFAYGYEAIVLADICEAVLAARDAGVLMKQQQHIADRCELLMRGFARVGIIALVDEATGYQEIRDRNALHKILAAYVSEELLPWAKRFPDAFYKQIFRLRGWRYSPLNPSKGPRFISHITNKLVYERLPEGVLEELRTTNPYVSENGQRKHKLHQFLTPSIGNPHLEKQVANVTVLMRAARNWEEFEHLFDRAFLEDEDEEVSNGRDGLTGTTSSKNQRQTGQEDSRETGER